MSPLPPQPPRGLRAAAGRREKAASVASQPEVREHVYTLIHTLITLVATHDLPPFIECIEKCCPKKKTKKRRDYHKKILPLLRQKGNNAVASDDLATSC